MEQFQFPRRAARLWTPTASHPHPSQQDPLLQVQDLMDLHSNQVYQDLLMVLDILQDLHLLDQTILQLQPTATEPRTHTDSMILSELLLLEFRRVENQPTLFMSVGMGKKEQFHFRRML